MNPIRKKTVLRILIHILFWVFYILVLFVFDPPYYGDLGIEWYEKINFDLVFLIAGMVYLNELFLLPYFFKRRWYALFALVNLGMLFFATTFYCYYLVGLECTVVVCLSNNLWLISLPVIFLSFVWVVLQFFEKQKELEKAHKDKLEMELKFLKSQINPHVLFNSLNTIYAQAIKESDTIAEMILMLSDNLKYVLNQSDDVLVDLEKDIAFIENYLKFQDLRTKATIKVNYTKEIDSYSHTIAPLILIDLIENAYKYAAYREGKLSHIDIHLGIENGRLHFICKNEFDPSGKRVKEDSTEIGLKNLRQRLKLIYHDDYTLEFKQENGMFVVDLKIKLL
jgi:two-component system LytT family sensor kinase